MKYLPKEPTPEMVKAWCANCHAWDLDAYKAMHQAAPEFEQEPVAYIAVRDFGIDITHIETIAIMWGVPYKPLYTNPQPKREPLSYDELRDISFAIYSALTENDNKGLMGVNPVKAIVDELVSQLKAHGIGVK